MVLHARGAGACKGKQRQSNEVRLCTERRPVEEPIKATEPKDFNAATDAKIKKLKSVFKKFDANGDGKLSATELRDVLEAVAKGDLSQQECQQLMQGLDRDQNGKVSVSEFIDYLTMSLVQTVP